MKNNLDINLLKRKMFEAKSGYNNKYMGLKYNRADVLVGDNSIHVNLSFTSDLNVGGWKIKKSLKFGKDKFQEQANMAKEIQNNIDEIVIKYFKQFEDNVDKDITKILKEIK